MSNPEELYKVGTPERDMQDKFERIFELNKVVFDEPGASEEQECLFVEIEQNTSRIQDTFYVAKITGTATLFGQNNKLPVSFFAKKIAKADPDDKGDFFFFNIDENTRRFKNIVQRSFSFVYFFKNQYDPNKGEMSELEITGDFTV